MYSNFSLFIIILLIMLYFQTIKSSQEINELNKQKVRACIKLQQKKFEENEEIMNEFIKNKSEVYKRTPNKVIILAMAYCYDKISYEKANEINKIKSYNLNITRLGIQDIYDFEKYDYDDQEQNRIIYDNFMPTFEVVFQEITDKEERNSVKDRFKVYFIHTKLFKFFIFYTIINCIIIFYIRLKNQSKNTETDNYFDKEDNNKKNKNNEEEIKEDKDYDYRKLKKKNRLGKNKKNK